MCAIGVMFELLFITQEIGKELQINIFTLGYEDYLQ